MHFLFILVLASVCWKNNISIRWIWTSIVFLVHKCQKTMGSTDVKVHFVFEKDKPFDPLAERQIGP